MRKSPVRGPAWAESPASPEPRATPWVPYPHSLRPVRAKVKVNRSPILLPLQGVDVYTLIPRALPWAGDWLPFQGAPFRALFVYHVRMLCHLLFGKKRAEFFFGILNTYLPFSPHQTHSNKASDFCRLLSLGAVAAGGVSSSCSESFTGFGLGFGMSNSSVSLYPKERSR